MVEDSVVLEMRRRKSGGFSTINTGAGSNRQLGWLRRNSHVWNAAFGVLDYLAYPLGLLAIAPIALRALGIERYGVWIMATAAVGTGAIVASGFADANTRIVARHKATDNQTSLLRAVRTAIGIHFLLGTVAALIGWCFAPWATRLLVAAHPALVPDCRWSLRLASFLILTRSLESVCVSTQRAFGRYGAAVQVSLVVRLLSLAAAGVLPFVVPTVTSVMIASALLSVIGVALQLVQLRRLLGTTHLGPLFHRQSASALLGFGTFTWIQAVCGVVFGQVDRLIAGFIFGAAAVASYGMAVQLTQPIYGVAAAGLHFIFPYVASQQVIADLPKVRQCVFWTVAINSAFVAIGLAGMLLFGVTLLRLWGGEAVARTGSSMMSTIALSTAMSSLSIAGCYSMLALGHPRTVALLNLLGGGLMIASIPVFTHRYGLYGMAMSRLLYGPMMLLVYLPLYLTLRQPLSKSGTAAPQTVCEEV